MKDAFENSFKESLDNFELPYDSAAWDAMQSRMFANGSGFEQQMKDGLNATDYPYNAAAWTSLEQRLNAGKKGGFKKWYVAAGILAVASFSTFLLLQPDEESADTKTITTESSEVKENGAASDKTISHKTLNANTGNQNVSIISDNNSSNGASNPDPNIIDPVNSGSSGNTAGNVAEPNNSGTSSQGTSGDQRAGDPTQQQNVGTPNTPTQTPDREWNYVSPAIASICKGIPVQIENKNDFTLAIIYPNGLNWTARKNSVATLNPSMAGVYKMGYIKEEQFIEEESFVVAQLDDADFEFVDLSKKYLDGLPTTEVSALSSGETFAWSYPNGKAEGSTANLHFYSKGLHEITLEVTGANGCSSRVSKTVSIDEDYNLMAVNAFVPNGTDIDNNRFMPYALTKRDVSFTLIILDPNDGHLIYSTTDATEGWDGIDRNTGSMVDLERNYIWKVTVHNPEQGETGEYVGTILPLPTR